MHSEVLINSHIDFSAHGVMNISHLDVFQDTDTQYIIYVVDFNDCVVRCEIVDCNSDEEIWDVTKDLAWDFNCKVNWYTDNEVNQIITQYLN